MVGGLDVSERKECVLTWHTWGVLSPLHPTLFLDHYNTV
jgi:hypothetical protein